MNGIDNEKFNFPEKIDEVDSIYDNYQFCLNKLSLKKCLNIFKINIEF